MHRRHVLAALVVTALAASVRAADPNPATSRSTPAIDADEIGARIAWLADDAREGRESGTPGGAAAEEYVAGELARAGLEPLGSMVGDPYVHVPLPWKPLLPAATFVDASFPDGTSLRTTPNEGTVPFGYANGGTVGGTLVFAGYGLTTAEHNDWKGIDARGKVALVVRHGPREEDPQSPWFLRRGDRGRMMSMSFVQKAKNAAAAGAVAMIVVNDVHHGEDALPVSMGEDESPIPIVAMRRATANRLLAPLGRELMHLEKAIDADLKCMSADVPGVSVTITTALGEATARDVVFVRRGSDPALRAEAVVLGAHMDHVGWGWFGSPSGGGQVHNGADDNASGTAAMIEVAEALAAGPPMKRSVIFAGWCAEEKGLIGSDHWVKHPTWDLAQVVANVNLDMVGHYRGGEDDPKFQVVGGPTGAGLEELAHRAAKSAGLRPISTWEAWEQSDHFSFYRRKIPVLFLHTGLHPDYHRPGDDFVLINVQGAANSARATAEIVRAIADRADRPAFAPRPPRPILGVQIGDSKDGAGALLAQIVPKGPAAAAGLQAKDVVTSFGGVAIKNGDALSAAIAQTAVGDVIEVVYRRGAETLTAKVTIAGR